MDSSKCVVCFEEKAKNFCIDCKQSSGLCHSCYMDISQRTDDSSYVPINCVICKKKMNYSSFFNKADSTRFISQIFSMMIPANANFISSCRVFIIKL